MVKPINLENIWIARATLFDSTGKTIGTCTDGPNAIAKAFMENHKATTVRECLCGVYRDRTEYTNRMNLYNTCPSGFVLNKDYDS